MANWAGLGAVAGGILGGMQMRKQFDARKEQQERDRARFAREKAAWAREDENLAASAEQAKNPGLADFVSSTPDEPTPAAAPTETVDPLLQNTMGPNRDAINLGGAPTQSAAPSLAAAQPKKVKAQYRYDKLEEWNQQLLAKQNEALASGNQRMAAIIENQRKMQLGAAINAFQDKDNASAYLEHIKRVTGALDKPMSPEEFIKMETATKAYDTENALPALMHANNGDAEAALAAYNSAGKHRLAKVELIPEMSSLGTKSNRIIGIDEKGNRRDLGNAFDAMSILGGVKTRLELEKARMEPSGKTTTLSTLGKLQSEQAGIINNLNAAKKSGDAGGVAFYTQALKANEAAIRKESTHSPGVSVNNYGSENREFINSKGQRAILQIGKDGKAREIPIPGEDPRAVAAADKEALRAFMGDTLAGLSVNPEKLQSAMARIRQANPAMPSGEVLDRAVASPGVRRGGGAAPTPAAAPAKSTPKSGAKFLGFE